MGLKVWVDDVRQMPSRFDMHVSKAQSAIKLLQRGLVSEISLDYSLGRSSTANGLEIARWIELAAKSGKSKRIKVSVHTDEPEGRAKIMECIRRAEVYWRGEQP